MSIKEIKKIEGTWVFLGAVSGVELTQAVNNEHKILNVILVSSQYLNRRRRKFGLERKIKDLSANESLPPNNFFSESKVFATFRRTGMLNEIESKVVEMTGEELAILASSQLGYRPRKHNAKIRLVSRSCHEIQRYFFMNEAKKTWVQPNILFGRFGILTLDERWKNFAREVFYTNLLKILQRKVRVADSWRKDLKNALIFIGQSQSTMDLPKAYLWNMIALELLLTGRDDKVAEQLPRRSEAFLSWLTGWDSIGFRRQIKELYKKRNALVHQGKREEIKPGDVLFLDDLLLNVLTNIGSNTNSFPSKDKLIEFSKKVEAEAILGITKSKSRPKTLRHIRRFHNPIHYEW